MSTCGDPGFTRPTFVCQVRNPLDGDQPDLHLPTGIHPTYDCLSGKKPSGRGPARPTMIIGLIICSNHKMLDQEKVNVATV